MTCAYNGVGKHPLVVVTALAPAHIGPGADHGLERLGIGRIPASDVRIGARGDEPSRIGIGNCASNVLTNLREQRAVTVNRDYQQFGCIVTRQSLCTQSLVVLEGAYRSGMATAGVPHSGPQTHSLLLGHSLDEWHEQPLVGEVFDEELDQKRLTHQSIH